MKRYIRSVASATILAVAFLGVFAWYRGTEQPLTDVEIDRYLSILEDQTQDPGGRHDLVALRSFLEQDDGRAFYTVNLYKFRTRADYRSDNSFAGTGREAYDRFSRVMIKLLAARGSHPIFGSDWIDANGGWDRIVIVRYRSRRDIVDLFTTPEFANASLHKWASLADNERLLVQGLHIPGGGLLIFIAFIIIGLPCCVYLYRRSGPDLASVPHQCQA